MRGRVWGIKGGRISGGGERGGGVLASLGRGRIVRLAWEMEFREHFWVVAQLHSCTVQRRSADRSRDQNGGSGEEEGRKGADV